MPRHGSRSVAGRPVKGTDLGAGGRAGRGAATSRWPRLPWLLLGVEDGRGVEAWSATAAAGVVGGQMAQPAVEGPRRLVLGGLALKAGCRRAVEAAAFPLWGRCRKPAARASDLQSAVSKRR